MQNNTWPNPKNMLIYVFGRKYEYEYQVDL
jgi:hypothetical protein